MIEERIAELRGLLETLEDERNGIDAEIAEVKKELSTIAPPFEPGDKVSINSASGGSGEVLAIERAFGEWVVQVSFHGRSGKPYYYPASGLLHMEEYTG